MPPNIVLLVIDDVQWDALGGGKPFIHLSARPANWRDEFLAGA